MGRRHRDSTARRRVGQILLSAVRHDPDPDSVAAGVDALTGEQTEMLVDRADYHGVSGYVHRALQHTGRTEHEVFATLGRRRVEALAHHARCLQALIGVGDVLDDVDVPWLVVKGPTLAAAHGDPALRSYGDVDLVVPGPALGRALAAMNAAGWPTLDRNWRLLRQQRLGQVHVGLPYGVIADVHWHLMYTRERRERFSVPMPALFADAAQVSVDGVRVTTLSSVDTFLYVALHAALSGGDRLRWLKDLEHLVPSVEPHWDDVVRRSHDWGAGLLVALMLERARILLGARIPTEVLVALSTSRIWRGAGGIAHRLSPVHRRAGERSLDRLVVRATRHDLTASVHQLTRRLRPRRRHGFAPGAHRRPVGPWSAYHPAGTEEDRRSFLSQAAEHDDPIPQL